MNRLSSLLSVLLAVVFTLAVLSMVSNATAASLRPDEASFIRPLGPSLSGAIRISQVYGGGGNSGATYKRDFIELFNVGTTAVTMNGWSVQYAAATSASWASTIFTAALAPGQYFLVAESAGGSGTTDLPTPDITGTINLAATAGKVALVDNATALSGTCPTSAGIVDFVGYGTTANCSETSDAPAPSNTNADLRKLNGCQDLDDNSQDFSATSPNPRNTSSPINICGLSIGKSAVASTDYNSAFTYTLTITNATIAATDVVITDLFPSNVTYVPNSASDSGELLDGTTISWTIASLTHTAIVRRTFMVTAPLTAGPIVNDRFRVSASNITSDAVGSAITTSVLAPALGLIKSVTPNSSVAYHSLVTYSIVVSNSGAADAPNTFVTDTLPNEVDFAHWITQSGASQNSDQITWNGTISIGQSITFTFVVTHAGSYGDVVTNTAHFDQIGGSGSASAPFTVEASPPSLSMSKSVEPDMAAAYHGEVTYTIELTNSGTADASDTFFTDTLPGGVTFARWIDQSGANENANEITWNGIVTAANAIHFEFVATHTGTYGDVITNSAQFAQASGAGSSSATFNVEPLYPITFVYHDGEDVVLNGEPVSITTDFNGVTPLNADTGYTTFSDMIDLPAGVHAYRYVVADQPAWLNTLPRSITVTGAATIDDYRNVIVEAANLQAPTATTTTVGAATENIFGRVHISGVTEPPGEGRGIHAQLGYGTDSNPINWIWSPLSFDSQVANDDQFQASIVPTATGLYSYAVRFDANWGIGNPNAQWTYGDLDDLPFSIDQAGRLQVLTGPSLSIEKQVTPTLRVSRGGIVTYTIVLANGGDLISNNVAFTDTLPAQADFSAWIISPTNTIEASDVITWSGSLQAGETITFSFTSIVTGAYASSVTNTASIAYNNVVTSASASFMFDSAPIAINEIDSDNVGADTAEFIELYDGGAGNTPLNGLVVVLFNGADDKVYASAFDLDGYSTNSNGYFVIGGNSVSLTADLIVTSSSWLQNGPDAAALFVGNAGDFPVNKTITNTDLSQEVDAIVYRNASSTAPDLQVLLNTNEPQPNENARGGTTGQQLSLQRCSNGSGGVRNTSTYYPSIPTPQTTNACPLLNITKIVSPTNNVAHHGTVTYTLVLSNGGAGDALATLLTDTLPSEVDFASWIDRAGANVSSDVITWTGSVTADQAITFTLVVTHVGNYNDAVTNTARFDQNTGSGSASAVFAVASATPNLFMSKSVSPNNAVAYHGEVTYTIELTNSGAADAITTLVTDTLPSEVDFARWITQSGASVNSDQITWSGTVSSGQSIAIVFVATHAGSYGDIVTNTAQFDQAGGSGSSSATFTVVPAMPHLLLTKNVNPSSNVANQSVVTYTIVLTNAGSAAVNGVLMTDTLPGALTFSSWIVSPTNTILSGNALTWSGNVTAGQVISWNFTSIVSGAGLTVINTAQIDYQAAITSASATVTIRPSINVLINELDSQMAGTDTQEFVELYDGGVGHTPLDGLALVFFNGGATNEPSYFSIDLDSHQTDVNGYFVVGNSVVASAVITFADSKIQNGPDAVGLFAGSAIDFPNGTPATNTNLIDAVVYSDIASTGDDAVLRWMLLNAGQPLVVEGGNASQADIKSAQRCPNGSGGYHNTSTYLPSTPTPGAANACPVLSLTKDVTPTRDAAYHGNVTYTLVLSNSGAGDALTTLLTDTLPSEVDFARWINRSGANVTSDVITWTGEVTANQAIMFTFVVTHVGSYGDVVTNTAQFEHNAGSGSSSATFSVIPPTPHLSMLKSVSPTTNVNYHGNVTYTIVLSNDGGVNAVNTFVTDTLPIEVDFARWLDRPIGAAANNDRITWNGTVSTGQSFAFTFVVTHSGAYGDVVTNTAQFDHLSGSGSSSAAFMVGVPMLAVKKSVTPTANVSRGGVVTYTVVLTNSGNMLAHQVVFTDVLPNGATFNSWIVSPTNTSKHNNTLTWLGDLNAGQVRAWKFTAIVTGAYASSVTNTATIAFNTALSSTNAAFSFEPTHAVMINEIDSDTPGTDTAEFIELYDGGAGHTALDGLAVVLFNGADGEVYAPTFDLDGYRTDANGYFVIGNSAVAGAVITFADSKLQNGPDAAALFAGSASDFPVGKTITETDLSKVIDAIVYGNSSSTATGLLPLLKAGQSQVNENGRSDGAIQSLQRCLNGSGGARNTGTYYPSTPTPGAANACPSLSIAKLATPNNHVAYHGNVTYTLVLSNKGAGDAIGPRLTDTLPIATNFARWINRLGANVSSDVITWTGSVTAHQSITFTFVVTHAGNYGDFVRNTVQFNHTTRSGSASATFTVDPAMPHLSIAKRVDPSANVSYHGTVTYTLVVSNDGSADAPGTFLTDTLPSEVDFDRWIDQSSAVVNADRITWHGTLSIGQALTLTFVVSHVGDYGEVVTNTAQFGQASGSGVSSAAFHVVPASPHLILTKGVNPVSNVTNHDIVTYTLALTNDGAATAIGVRLTDTLPAATAFADWIISPTNTVLSHGVITWSGNVPAGSSLAWNFTVVVSGSGSTVSNTAQIDYQSVITAASAAFTIMPATNVLINELDGQNASTDAHEFIELYDGGVGNTSLDGLTLVFFNGGAVNDPAYYAIDLDQQQTDANGYFVVGNSAVASAVITFTDNRLQNGPDAVGLYFGQATDFPNGMPATSINLIDAIVYADYPTTGDDAVLRSMLLNTNQPIVNEGKSLVQAESNSAQRCPNGSGGTRNTLTYVSGTPTPGAVNACPVLSIAKFVTPNLDVTYHGIVTYTIVVLNGGTGDAGGVLVTDTLPIETDFARWLNQPIGAAVNADRITWSGAISIGQAITFTFVVTHVGSYGDVVTNTAQFNHASGSGSSSTAFIVIPATPSLSIAKWVTTLHTPAKLGDPVTYTIIVTNSGAGNAIGVVISDVLPSGVSGSNLHQTINISPGQHISISVTAAVTEDEDYYGQSVINTASFSHSSGGGVATATFTIENAPIQGAPPPDFGGSIKFSTPSNQRVLPNSLITYTLVLSNSGGVSATLHVTDVVGSYYTVFNALNFTQSPVGTLKWSGVVTAGQSITLNFVAKVNALTQLSIGHTLLNNTAVIDDGSDPPFNLDDPNPPWVDVYGIYLPIARKNS